MPENGSTTADKADPGGALLRFFNLAARGRRRVAPQAEPPRTPTEAEARAAALALWLQNPAALDTLFPWVDDMIAAARAQADTAIEENPMRAAKWMGVATGLSVMLDELIAIRSGQAPR